MMLERFFAKVDATADGCWEWKGSKSKAGYGIFNIGPREYQGKCVSEYAHRVSYELHVGPIPDDLTIDHLCRNTICVNPAHLEAVTLTENIRRAARIRRPRCPRGHEYDRELAYGEGRGMTVELLDIAADLYHADTTGDTPTLNATVAKSLVLETPAHARQKHPRLMDGEYVPRHTDAMDEGTALHQMLLGDDRCDVLPYADFRTKEAKDARDESRDRGRVPILAHKWADISVLGDSLKAQVAGFPIDPPLFVEGMAEQTIVWREGDVACRARLDWLRSDYRCIDDLKKSRSADPRRWQRAMWPLGYDIQAAFYVRACRAAFGVDPVFRWVAIEPEPPYALSVHVLSPDALKAAHDKVDLALDIWARCLQTGEWPAYAQSVNVVELPEWMRSEVWDDTALTEAPF